VVATQRAAIPPLERTLAQFRNALAVLMARSPEQVRIRGGSLNCIAVPRVTPGLPSELLTQRPDIREAEAQLAAANANVANARAQLLPSITLAGAGGYQSALLKTLLRPESAFLHARRRAHATDLRRRQVVGQRRTTKGQAGRVIADSSQGGDLCLFRCGHRVDRHP